ncbi:hypothetical protein JCM19241_2257 [Vibrio ishigakensis]|uniref:Uncharacterized protein n=1 Tax=Vibrio ishigakensis TaxID=1481914 RepID=A0A0B8Q765_9VIBR|nr:hypothetical protein JCM19241_2257 [Vibrio ishigakensis]
MTKKQTTTTKRKAAPKKAQPRKRAPKKRNKPVSGTSYGALAGSSHL